MTLHPTKNADEIYKKHIKKQHIKQIDNKVIEADTFA